MNVLITYDVNTETKARRWRLFKVAQTCKNFGQRVQYSVFECRVNPAQYEDLIGKLRKIIDPKSDSLRIYKLRREQEKFLTTFGLDRHLDFDGPLVL